MRRLRQIPGVGPLIAHALAIPFADARRFAPRATVQPRSA